MVAPTMSVCFLVFSKGVSGEKGEERRNRGLQWWDWRMFMGFIFEDKNSPRVRLGLQWSVQSRHHPLCASMPRWTLAVNIHPQRLAPELYQIFTILNSNAGHVGMLRNLWKQLLLFMAFKNQKKMLKNELKGTCSLLFWYPPNLSNSYWVHFVWVMVSALPESSLYCMCVFRTHSWDWTPPTRHSFRSAAWTTPRSRGMVSWILPG